MTDVLVSGLTKHYGGKSALHGLDLRIESGEFVTLLGPSGCGKTTTLRSLAGLERPTSGSIAIGGRVVVDTERGIFVPPEQRHVGMVFQSYALWPHLSVAENVAYPLKVAKVRGPERQERIREVLHSVGLADFEKRPVTALSGGQQQRVALARALAARPGIIFYDEPLSNLDTKLRYQMGQQVRALHNQYETTSVYVTHDQEEAITLSDRIVVMNHGEIVQDGTPPELYDRPKTAYVADFMGFQNILPGTVVRVNGEIADVRVDESSLVVSGTVAETFAKGDQVLVAFRAGHVRLDSGATPGIARFSVTTGRTTYLGSAINLLVHTDGLAIRARIDTTDLDRLGNTPRPGDALDFTISPRRAVVLPRSEPLHAPLEDPEATGAVAAVRGRR